MTAILTSPGAPVSSSAAARRRDPVTDRPSTKEHQGGPDAHRYLPSSRLHRRVRGALLRSALLVACLPPTSHADQLFGFTDDRGVFHFSDAPSDPRHAPLLAPTRTRMVRPDRGSAGAIRPGAELAKLIHDTARRTRVDPALIEAVALVESGFNERARSPKGALGLMQLMPATAMRFGVTDPFDPRQNLLGGARYLRELIDRFEALPLALAAYNAGEGAIGRYNNSIPPYAETVKYVPTVLGQYRRLQAPTEERSRALPRVFATSRSHASGVLPE